MCSISEVDNLLMTFESFKAALDNCSGISNVLKDTDNEILDIYHRIELTNFNACDGYKLCKLLQITLKKRRKVKDAMLMYDTFLLTTPSLDTKRERCYKDRSDLFDLEINKNCEDAEFNENGDAYLKILSAYQKKDAKIVVVADTTEEAIKKASELCKFTDSQINSLVNSETSKKNFRNSVKTGSLYFGLVWKLEEGKFIGRKRK